MRTSSALKKDLSGRKLSTKPSSKEPQGPVPGFDRDRLVSELLSLGNDKIRPELAKQIGEEVEAELQKRSSPKISAELISEIVQFKLQERGLIEIRRRRPKHPLSPEEEMTVSLHSEDPELHVEAPQAEPQEKEDLILECSLAAKLGMARLPTLEKFLRPATEDSSSRPLPPKASLKVAPQALRRLQEVFAADDAVLRTRLEALFEDIAGYAAAMEPSQASPQDPGTLAVEFFNVMANQEFYPHLPILFQFFEGPTASLRRWGPVVLSWRTDAALPIDFFEQATQLWKQGAEVAFHLENPAIKGRSATALLEDFFQAVEKAVMALPEDVEFPKSIPLRLRLDHPEADDIAALALSGKYYPKFRFEWGFHETGNASASPLTEEAYEKVLKMTWKKSEPSLVSIDKAYGASCFSRLGNLESGHSGGTSALSRNEGGSLGSLNLSIVGTAVDVDWTKLRRIVRSALHFLSNLNLAQAAVEDLSPAAQETPALPRLGVMGFAELLFKLGIPYDSDDAVVLAEKLFRFMRQEIALFTPNLAEAKLLDVTSEPALADLAEVSPGLQPLEKICDAELPHPLLKQIAQKRQVWSAEIEAEVLAKGSVRDAESAPRPLRRLFLKREEIAALWPLKILGSVQAYCDRMLCGELSLGQNPGLPELNAALTEAQDCGLFQFQVSRNASLEEESLSAEIEIEVAPIETEALAEPIATEVAEASLILSLEDLAIQVENEVLEIEEEVACEDDELTPLPIFSQENSEDIHPPADSLAAAILGVEDAASPNMVSLKPRERPEVLQATSRLIQTGCGPLHVSFARDAQGPYEVRAALGQSGTCANTQTEAISRLLTLCLSTGVDQRLVYEQLRGLRCPNPAVDHGDEILSCADGIAKVFERELGLNEKAEPTAEDDDDITVVTDLDSLH